MSYDLFYDKNFIKAEKDGKDVFFPMIYGGSSNCFEVGRNGRSGRRERSWFNLPFILKGKQFGTMEEMLKNADAERLNRIKNNEERNEEYKAKGDASWCTEYSDERWGYFTGLAIGGSTSKTSFGQYKGLFSTGCKKALTVEELKEFGVSVHLYTSIYSDEGQAKFKEAGKEQINFYPQTSKELIEKTEEFEEYLKDTNVNLYITLSGADEYTMKRIRRNKFPIVKHPKQNVTVDKFFVIKDETTGHYVMKLRRNGYSYSYNGKAYCKKFVKEAEAKRYMKKVAAKFGTRVFIVEEVNEKTQVCV